MNKKYMVMFGTVIGFVLIVLLTVTILSSCNKKLSNESIEKKMVSAAKKYAEKEKVKTGENVTVDIDKLVEKGYMKELSKYTDDKCDGYVKIYNNSGVMNYLPYLECSKYKTKTLGQKMIDDSLTGDYENVNGGLFNENGEYVFKGKSPRNYVKVGSKVFLAFRIDAEGDLKLLYPDSLEQEVVWDNKYNGETKSRTGENDYETSYVKDYLYNYVYKKYSDNVKKHIIPKSICIGKRENSEIVLSNVSDCTNKIDNQYIGLINTSDYALASLDKDCTSVISGDCYNFNYLKGNLKHTWTLNAVKNNTYQTIAYNNGYLRAEDVGELDSVQPVLYISGDEIYDKGNGTKESPYEFKEFK